MNPPSPEARILTSSAFRKAWVQAADVTRSPTRLRRLLGGVERTCAQHPGLREGPRALAVDIICVVVDAHLEAAATTGIDPLAVTTQTRLRLVVAALLHLMQGPLPRTPRRCPTTSRSRGGRRAWHAPNCRRVEQVWSVPVR